MPEKLPKGWVKTTLGEIAEPSRERTSPMENPTMRYVGLEHIEPHSMRLLGHNYAREARSSSVRFSKGDILYGKMRPYLNKVWVAEFDGICSAEFLVFEKHDGLNSQFLALRLNAEDFVTFANGLVSGERPRVDFEKLSHFPILLPPLAEQERIVGKLTASLLGVGRAETAARRARERLKIYRAASLRAAVTGELTLDWRAAQRKRKSDAIENGEALLQRLLVVRRDGWEKAELKRRREKGKISTKDKWKSRYPEPARPNTTELPELPETWSWASLEMVAEIGSGKTQLSCRISESQMFCGDILILAKLRQSVWKRTESPTIFSVLATSSSLRGATGTSLDEDGYGKVKSEGAFIRIMSFEPVPMIRRS